MLLPTRLSGQARLAAAAQILIDATVELAGSGRPLMRRIVPDDAEFAVWQHYPDLDAVDRRSGARWFYHAHPVEDRAGEEHGHFHLFFERSKFRRPAEPLAGPAGGKSVGADIVHIAALSVDLRGIPVQLFTVNRWVTDEWFYPADAVLERLARFDLSGAPGDPLVNRWLTSAVACMAPEIAVILRERDAKVAGYGPDHAFWEDRNEEILSAIPIDLQRVATEFDR